MIDEKKLIIWIKCHCNPYGKPDFDYDTSIKIIDFIENQMTKVDERTKDCPFKNNLSDAGMCYKSGYYCTYQYESICKIKKKYMHSTNADRIRSMTYDELVDIILCPYDTPISPENIMPCVKDGVQQLVAPDECHRCMMKWLQSESEE